MLILKKKKKNLLSQAGIIMGPSLLAQSKVYAATLFPPGARYVLITFAEFGVMLHLFI